MNIYIRSMSFAAGYALVAGIAIAFSRFHGGFATFWFATAYLSATLSSVPRRDWLPIVLACFVANTLVTGTIGLGWTAAAPISAVNMLEAVVASTLIRQKIATNTLDSFQWFIRFTAKVGLIAPVIGATFGSMSLLLLSGQPVAHSWITWFIGHALGGVTFTPFFLLLMRGDFRRFATKMTAGNWLETFWLFLLFVTATVITFSQTTFPILFFPLGPLSLICFRQDRVVAASAIATLALIGAVFTASGHGPISLMPATEAVRSQFFQFYLASVVLTVFPITADLRHRKRLWRRVRESEQRFELLLDNSSDAVFHLSTDGKILYASPSVQRLCGFSIDEIGNGNVLDLVEPDWQDHVQQCHAEVLTSLGKTVRYEFLARDKDGVSRWFETLSRAVCNPEGEAESVVSIVRDSDARKREELNLIQEARIDGLTGLLNRRGLESRFEEIRSGEQNSLAILDIDHFKVINDQYGHAAGDRALQTFADIVLRTVRKDDCVARIGGEEFVILFCGLTESAAQQACERLRVEIANAITFFGAKTIHFTVSIGLTEVRSTSLDIELAKADAALYEAKRGGRDCLRLAA